LEGNHLLVKKKGLKERLESGLAAAAFAEAGEFQMAEEILQVPKKIQTVLLVIEGEVPNPSAFRHALNLCKRLDAEMDILQVIENSSSQKDYEALSRKMALGSAHVVALLREVEKEGIPFKITIRLGDVKDKLFNYARRHKDVGTVVFDSPKAASGSAEGRRWQRVIENLSQRLSIPLVTVVGQECAEAFSES
jgi:hypothetical protein